MARSLKENDWTDRAVLGVPVASLNVSWTGPVTGPSAALVVQDNLRTYEEESKQYKLLEYLNEWMNGLNEWVRPVISASQWDFNHRVFLQSLYTYMQYTYFTNNISGLLLVYSASLRTQIHQCSVPDSELVVVRAHMYTCGVVCALHRVTFIKVKDFKQF